MFLPAILPVRNIWFLLIPELVLVSWMHMPPSCSNVWAIYSEPMMPFPTNSTSKLLPAKSVPTSQQITLQLPAKSTSKLLPEKLALMSRQITLQLPVNSTSKLLWVKDAPTSQQNPSSPSNFSQQNTHGKFWFQQIHWPHSYLYHSTTWKTNVSHHCGAMSITHVPALFLTVPCSYCQSQLDFYLMTDCLAQNSSVVTYGDV